MTVFIQVKTRDEILYELSSENWLNKHEVLTRWAWMKSQKALADKRRIRFNYLYECEVGERDGRQNLDREFYDFLHCLPEYSAQVGKEFLFLEKSESPDFVVVVTCLTVDTSSSSSFSGRTNKASCRLTSKHLITSVVLPKELFWITSRLA